MSLIEGLGFTGGTGKSVVGTHDPSALEHNRPADGEAGLADIVGRLIDSWLVCSGQCVGGITAQRNRTASERDQRVFAALIDGCLQFQIFLLHLGQIRLELQKSGVVSEESLLRLEQLLQKGSGFLVDESGVAHRAHSLGDVAGSGD